MSENVNENILVQSDPLGDLDFLKMVPDALTIITMLVVMAIGIAGFSLAFRARDGKTSAAIMVITICMVVLGIIGVRYFLPILLGTAPMQ